jgi:hypothetical protein
VLLPDSTILSYTKLSFGYHDRGLRKLSSFYRLHDENEYESSCRFVVCYIHIYICIYVDVHSAVDFESNRMCIFHEVFLCFV